ncbi:PAS domain S-box protein [Gilvimarinus sp. SDUM040013]|uniref:histidine kinase n=1 Tax=Gilvimarinus gilvus TaxID=3058038 RepID=A0ABU4S0Z9_9GAMM|nr:PAS domain S-box protein [Gilvimarinus sp. SDUM040013]MDO3384823.1 PAS domain S-box protein [Gilvimarinus sp. SDUM040013]MDX6850844.1 PAS domain S-box protein [Gilvimarinus sp. SDUM040013]
MTADMLGFLSQDFMPHGHCYMWQPAILWTNVISDAMIALAYFSIPAGLIYIRKRRRDLMFPSLFILFSLFILLCGLTHVYSIYTIWVGSYGVHGAIKAATATVSVITAIALIYMVPRILATPSIDQLRQAVNEANKEKLDRLSAEAQYESDRNLREAANASPVGLMVVDDNGQITMANDALCTLFGYQLGELAGENVTVLIERDMRGSHGKLLQSFFTSSSASRAMASGRVVHGVHKSGQKIPIEIRLIKKTINDEDKVFAAVTDVSEKLASQERLAKANHRFERITSATREGLWEWQLESNTLWWSSALWQLFGYQKEPAELNMGLWEAHVHDDDRSKFFSAMDKHIINGDDFDVEFRAILVNREVRWFRVHGECVGEEGASNRYMCGSVEDIQQRKDMALSLSEKNQFLESIFSGTSYGLFVLDCLKDGRQVFTSVNPTIESALGTKIKDLKNKTVSELAPRVLSRESAEKIEDRYRLSYETGRQQTYVENVEIKGHSTWWKTSLYPVMDEVGDIYRIVGSSVEITELKETESKLKESEQFLSAVVESSLCGLYILDIKDDKNVFVNERYTAITGYALKDLESLPGMASIIHPEDVAEVRRHVQRVIQNKGAVEPIEYRLLHKNGHWIWCYSYDMVFRFDPDRNPIQMLGSFIDISDLKESSEKLKQSNKDLENFAYMASHDLQEPLRKIIAFSTSVEAGAEIENVSEDTRYAMKKMAESSRVMKDLVKNILQVSKVASREVSVAPEPLSDLMAEVREILSEDIDAVQPIIEVVRDATLSVDRFLFVQLLKNLVGNAIKYKSPDRELIIRIDVTDRYEGRVVCGRQITVSDNGIGFDNEDVDKMFSAFGRLDNELKNTGSGMGLAICRQVVNAHKGTIHAQGVLGEGATFFVDIPDKLSEVES